jgi:phosphoadenosine phosphosulfate reductase
MPVTAMKTSQPNDLLKQAFASHKRLTISFSGAEDVVLVDMACQLSDQVEVFCLDTGRLHPETYRYIDQVRNHYGIEIDLLSPDAVELAAMVKAKGLFSFYEDGHQQCCSVRKIAPLRRHLVNYDAWITGQRRDQSPTRADVPQTQPDKAFGTVERPLTKYNPLAQWSSAEVWQYIRDNGVPYNPLHDQGFQSIGCEPCTRPIGPNQHERAGRWWWEEATQRECGLHAVNLVAVKAL